MMFNCYCGKAVEIKDGISELSLCTNCGKMFTKYKDGEDTIFTEVNPEMKRTFGECRECGEELVMEELGNGVCMICKAISQ